MWSDDQVDLGRGRMIKDELLRIGACRDAIREHGEDESIQQAWDKCQRPNWMIWLLKKINEKENKVLYVKITLEFAKSVIELSKDSQQRPQKAIQAVEQWLLNPIEENRLICKNAADAAYAAADAAYAAAAYAVAYAADAAYAAAVYAAEAAEAATRINKKKSLCDIIRQIHPIIGELVK